MKRPEVKINYRVAVPLVALFVILTLVFPRSAKFAYDYKKGSPWAHETLLAQFDFPILKTDEQLREERSKNKSVVVPYYRFHQDVVDNSVKAAGSLDLGGYSSFRPQVVSALESIYSHGIVTDEGVKLDKGEDPNTAVIYVQKDKRAAKRPASEIYKESDARAKLLSEVSAKHPKSNVDSVLRATGVYELISPNLEYDSRTTDLVNSEATSKISTTQGFVSAGELIVKEGEIVTAEVAQILDSYKVEFENNMGYGGPKIVFWIGNALLALIITLLFFLVIYFLNKRIFKDTRRFWYLALVVLISALTTLAVNRFAPKFLYMVPFTLTALYLEAFFKNKMIVPICVVSFMPLLIFPDYGVMLFVMFIVASVVAVFAFKYFNQGWQQFITAIIVFVSLLVTYFAFRCIGKVSDDPYQAMLFLFIGSMLNVAGYPLIYLFEKMFGLVSNSRLRELCDTNNPLLRDLEQKAPGTFQHSLQVMHMADAAARSIGANVALVRAGAMYHDIGKMANPQCFVENEAMGNHYHEGLSSKESAREIVRHVPDGVALARKYKLPEILIDFIRSHHGVSCTGYFYNKFVNAGGDPADKADFTYDGQKPRTREQCIVMLCDTIEAASRTLKDNSPETFDAFVEKMVRAKIDDGQLSDSEVSLKDLGTVKAVLKSYLSRLYHDRIAYPKREK